MKAIVQDVYGPADVLKLRDIGRPSIGAGEVLVQVRAAGVDPGVWHLMTGEPYLGGQLTAIAALARATAGAADAAVLTSTARRACDPP